MQAREELIWAMDSDFSLPPAEEGPHSEKQEGSEKSCIVGWCAACASGVQIGLLGIGREIDIASSFFIFPLIFELREPPGFWPSSWIQTGSARNELKSGSGAD